MPPTSPTLAWLNLSPFYRFLAILTETKPDRHHLGFDVLPHFKQDAANFIDARWPRPGFPGQGLISLQTHAL